MKLIFRFAKDYIFVMKCISVQAD